MLALRFLRRLQRLLRQGALGLDGLGDVQARADLLDVQTKIHRLGATQHLPDRLGRVVEKGERLAGPALFGLRCDVPIFGFQEVFEFAHARPGDGDGRFCGQQQAGECGL